MCRRIKLAASVFVLTCLPVTAFAQQKVVHDFKRQQLTDVYFSEGANAGDIDGDGNVDAVYGPYWFAGPKFDEKHEIYQPAPQNREGYADNFFSWVYDFNSDGQNDVFVVGFPGTPAYVYENPGKSGLDSHWKKHEVFDWVSNESPQFVDMVGDDRPELVCTRDGFFGYVTVDWEDPFSTWTFHRISERIAAERFGHGLGIGDVNGDDRKDVIFSDGWFEQPEGDAATSRWQLHPADFSSAYGGAEMYAYDVDGDGDQDVITSEAAHDFGLSWYEQVQNDDAIDFKRHVIMGAHPSENHYGVLFSELHSVNLVDMDGDGLKDIVTGKTFYSHHKQSPMWDAGAVVYWFRLVRNEDGVDWIPYQIDDEAGIGRQLSVHDVNQDGLPDVVVGGMKGSHVLIHSTRKVDDKTWQSVQPKEYSGPPKPTIDGAEATRGPKAKIDEETGKVAGAMEGETLKPEVSGGQFSVQDMSNFKGDRWSGDSQLWWRNGMPGDTFTVKLPKMRGTYNVEMVLTCARDYGVFKFAIDGKPLGKPVDLYHTDVVTSGVLTFPAVELSGDDHQLEVTLLGRNPQAAAGNMFAIDYLRFVPADSSSK